MKAINTFFVAGTIYSVLSMVAYAQDTSISACEKLINDYEFCVKKNADAAQQKNLKPAIEEMRAELKKETPENQVLICQQIANSIKAGAVSLGCKF